MQERQNRSEIIKKTENTEVKNQTALSYFSGLNFFSFQAQSHLNLDYISSLLIRVDEYRTRRKDDRSL